MVVYEMDIAEKNPYIKNNPVTTIIRHHLNPKGSGKIPMKIVSIAISRKKGTRKQCVESAELIADHGLSADAHAGRWHRQISFLAAESIENARERGLTVDFGDFAENIATTGIDW
ncbi:MAG: hypothetical protein ACWGNK_11205, partial [Desulfobacterales bacterium]